MLPLSSRGSLIQVLGTGAQSGYTFAELLDQLLLLESSTGHFALTTPSDRAGDFTGVDSLAEVREGFDLFGVTGRIGFQYKFVPSESLPLGKSHRKQIEESLKKFARREDKKPIACWILITPEDFNKNQLEWLLGLKAEHKIRCDIRHWGQKQLTSLIMKHPQCAVHLYPELARGIRPLSFRDMCQRLLDSYSLVDSHSRFHIEPTISDGRTITSALQEFLISKHNLLCLLGGYGTGKSNTLEHLSLELAKAHIHNEGARIPVLVKLRDVRGDASFAHNVITYVHREYGIDVDATGIKSLNGAGNP